MKCLLPTTRRSRILTFAVALVVSAGCGQGLEEPALDEGASPAPFTAVMSSVIAGCDGKVTDYADNWPENAFYQVPKIGFPYFRYVDIRLVGTVMYWNCPQGDKPNKVKAKWIDWCWTFYQPEDEEHLWFDGVTFNARIYDSAGVVVNPPEFKVGDDGTIQNCRRQNIPEDAERWMFQRDDPRWSIRAVINVNNHPDQDWTFETSSGSTIHYLLPANDIQLSEPHL